MPITKYPVPKTNFSTDAKAKLAAMKARIPHNPLSSSVRRMRDRRGRRPDSRLRGRERFQALIARAKARRQGPAA